jgi:methylmalonyl-CoA mutase N-terminal domain/subunit
MNNVTRVAIQALAAVLGGTQSLHTNSLDEAWALPSQDAATIALRTQQIIANESGVTNTVDPLGGSYFVEALTNRMEQEANAYFEKVEKFGGVIPALTKGFFQREIAESAARYQTEIEKKDRIIVGVNDFVVQEELKVPLLRVDEAGAQRQIARLQKIRRERDGAQVGACLDAIRDAAKKERANLMPPFIAAVNAYATLGEIMDVLRKVWGEYKEPVIV